MTKSVEKYQSSFGSKINDNTDVEFNRRKDGYLDIKITTFGKHKVILSEDTLEVLYATYVEYLSGINHE